MSDRICTVEGCGKKFIARGLCQMHYTRAARAGGALPDRERRAGRICAVEGCGQKHEAHGWCKMHYLRWRRHGDPLAGGPPRNFGDLETRFWARVDKTDDCWLWTGTIVDGYGFFGAYKLRKPGQINGMVRAHRFSYELINGPIPDGLQIDHICQVRNCVRPEHLRMVTNKQNTENHHGRAQSHNRSSGKRGVTWDKRSNKWCARVRHAGRWYHAGLFDSLDAAAMAAQAKRNELFTHNDRDRSA